MRFLIENYASYESTQPLYFHKHISDMPEHTSMIRTGGSIFDVFDLFKPDVYISSANKLSRDVVMYLVENKDKDIRLVVCVDGLNNEEIQNLDSVLKSNGVECQFFFSTVNIPETRRTRVVQIKNGADINLEKSLKIDYNIQKALIVNKPSQIKNYEGTYHVISTNPQMKDNVDLCLPITMLPSIYPKYEEVIFTDLSTNLPQCFFDAIYSGSRVYYDILDSEKSKKIDEAIDNTFKIGNILNYNSKDKLLDFADLRKKVEEKHSSINRTKTLLSQLPQKVSNV